MNLATCSYWPLATTRQRRVQAVRLLKARRYLKDRGIAAAVTRSTFEYSSAPTVLK